MDFELPSNIRELAPLAVPFAIAIVAVGGMVLRRLRNSEDPLTQGRRRFSASNDPNDLHEDDPFRRQIEKYDP